MKMLFTRLLSTLFVSMLLLNTQFSNAQSTVFNPNDAVTNYNPTNPPTQPTSGPGKWVRTTRMTWNTSGLKCYIYKGIVFRLKYPKTYVPGNGQKYPLLLFFHGVGEAGNIYDNEYQLFHGGKTHSDAVDNNLFDGYLLYPQSTTGAFNGPQLLIIQELIEQYLIPEIQVDPFRISVNGLSGGGNSTWATFFGNPKLFAAVLPISNAHNSFSTQVEANKFTKIWLFQGALDKNPDPYYARALRNAAVAAGANFRYTEYPTRGHECWNQAWAEPDYFPVLRTSHKANPWSLGGRTEFCAEETINQVIGVGGGFNGYEWRKDGILIPGANSNTITATSIGVYDCRIQRGTDWSPWSPIPVELKLKTSNVSPTPEMVEFASKVLPSPDGKTTVQLKVAEGAASYSWTKAGSGVVGTSNIYSADAGTYQVVVVENSACQSTPSLPFTVINANGPNKPSPVQSLIVSKISKTSLKLNWIINPGSQHPATNFEIYQGTKAGGPYQFVGITDASVRTFTKVDLTPGVRYYYVVRAVNSTAGSDLSAEVSQLTDTDVTPPSAPANLRVTGTTRTSVAIEWNDATDDAGIAAYDIYVNGTKLYTTFTTSYIVSNLSYNNVYTINVKARDLADNESPFSNQVTARTVAKGLTYKYYTGAWLDLPDFNNTQIQGSGFVPNIDITKRTQETQFGFLWEGYIRIPVSGNYNFRTNSADGSKVYFNNQYGYSTTATVDNGGTHNNRTITSSTMYVAAGVYPIAITYFQVNSTPLMELYWRNPQSDGGYVKIPDSVFVEPSAAPTNLPAAPSSLNATVNSYKKVTLTWADNSNNETAFELSRSTDPIDNFAVIAALPANTTTFQDTTVTAATKYYYRVRAVNQNGESKYDKFGRGVDYSYYHTTNLTQLPNFNTLTLVKTGRIPNFSLGMQERNDFFAIKYDGFINITATGNYRFYTTSDDGSRLYINGNLIVDNDGAHGSTQQSGTINFSSTGLYPISVTYFENAGSEILTVSYERTSSGNPTIAKQVIPVTVLGDEYVNVTTSNAPAAPAAPSNLQATNITTTTARFTWTNNDPAVTKYEVYRSFENNQDYVLYATVANNYYADTVLFANSNVFYKVKGVSATGVSAFSNELSIVTLGETPALVPIETQYMRFGTQLVVQLNATITTNETITLSASNLPAFATFANTGNGKGTITFNNPSTGQQGTYNDITVTASSPQGYTSTRKFNLIVNSNNLPVVTGPTNVAVGVGQTTQVTMSATDADAADVITWSYQGLPSFVTISNNSTARTSVLTIAPLIGMEGTYNVIAKADDGKNGRDTMAFVITVSTAQEIYIHFAPNANSVAAAPWNSIGKLLAAGVAFPETTNPGLKDKNGVYTNVRIRSDKNGEASTAGVSTGSNSGVYPDIVLSTGYRVQRDNTTNFTISGLDKDKKYTFTFFASFSVTSANFSGKYTIGASSVSLDPTNNTQNVVKIYGAQPNASGEITFNVNRATANNAYYSYLNSVVVTEGGSDAQSLPTKITNLEVKFEDNAALLTWRNTASNATAYEIYRAGSLMGPYVLLNPAANDPNAQTYTDNTVLGNKTYYYFVRVKNSMGGINSATVKIAIPNRAPIIATSEAFCKTEQTTAVNVVATDDAGETITLAARSLPSFVTFTDNGNGNGSLQVSPAAGNKGVFNVNIVATDNSGASNSKIIKLYITDKNTSSMYVNFNSTDPVAGIWNSFNKAPTQGASISNLKNDMNVVTTAKVELVDGWNGNGNAGSVTGNNSGAYRDDVLKTYYSESGATARRVKITGLSTDPNVRYNLVLLGNVNGVSESTTTYSVGSKTATLNVTNNTDKTVQLNDITATAGTIEYTVIKSGTATVAYMNALVIQSYTTSTTLLSPDNAKAMGVGKNSINLVWNNRVNGGSVEIYRSTNATSGFAYVTTVSGNTYTDNGLAGNTEYFYKLKAINSPNVSDFSTTVSAYTYAYSVYINFNRTDPADAPWNNTNRDPVAEDVYPYFVNSDNNPSGITMVVGEGFSGMNPFGEVTGNNSGPVPDNVMRSSWWNDVGQAATLKFRGLSHTLSYRFTFFGSRAGVSPVRIATYNINGNIVKLKVSGNKTETVTINNVKADENGEVLISIRGEGSSAYIGGLIISASNSASTPIDGTPGESFRQQNNNSSVADNQNSIIATDDVLSASDAKVYPNPFSSELTLKLSLKSDVSKLNVKVTDPSGRVVLLREFKNLKKGTTVQALGLDKLKLQTGVYIISLYNDDGYILSPIKVLKTK